MEKEVVRQAISQLGLMMGNANVIVTHGDADHLNYVPNIFGTSMPKNIWLGGNANQYTNSDFSAWLSTQRKGRVPIVYGADISVIVNRPGELYDQGLNCGVANVYILAAENDRNKNANSLFMAFKYQHNLFLFTGDATGEVQTIAEAKLDKDPLNVAVKRVLIAPHHGGDTHGSNSPAFAEAVRARSVVFSAGNRYGHPRCNSYNAYVETWLLDAVPIHNLQCGIDNYKYETKVPTESIYSTMSSGSVIYKLPSATRRWEITCRDVNNNNRNC